MDTNSLKKWIIDNKIESNILHDFELEFEAYKTDSEDEFNEHFPDFDPQKLNGYLYKVALTLIGWGESEQECIIAFLKIRYNNYYRGEYTGVYSLNGEFIDNYLVIK